LAERTTSNAGAPTELPFAYARWRDSRLGRIADSLEQDLIHRLIGPVAGLRVLDVGCGDGQLALAFAQAGARVSAIDLDSRMLEAAGRRFAAAAVKVQLDEASAEILPFENDSFDVVSAVTVLCFVREPGRAIREMARVLNPGGRLVLGELARYSSWAAWRRLRGWLGHATWRAALFRTGGKLRDLAAGAGLIVETVRAAVFYPPVGWIAAMLAPLDKWLGRWMVNGGAFLVLVATKPFQ
jgi:SAM-dependent methyltransferase